ncbi:MAG: hypothetical protein ANABAC_3172 [Anaerolineae bacterium]|nr:MAG: hypothetical protein ANABAC_3172 [Anaerolineae bacterium]
MDNLRIQHLLKSKLILKHISKTGKADDLFPEIVPISRQV